MELESIPEIPTANHQALELECWVKITELDDTEEVVVVVVGLVVGAVVGAVVVVEVVGLVVGAVVGLVVDVLDEDEDDE